MFYTVLYQGVPIGSVELSDLELAVGTMTPNDAYRSLRPTIQAGSEALQRFGFFGRASRQDLLDPAPLAAAATLTFELRDRNGREVPATFVNLLEAPDDDGVIVLARLGHAAAVVPASRSPRRGAAPDASRPDA